ncbi:ABC-type transporter, substrate-binding lipoprotein [Corynebacterium glyciniphilum AJ 3170]|uniref:ABC-type transporter, substrate-binding lipoprotein n=1 Tax=Corynebacterium glyciniphilum AJ 3170 TaxID=1404245 RepID=X5DQE2_9CORY|nr:ABC transporter substrate-binding protein [Corynebacterium glyciniphilum]AHW63509.1 ABC-type transporter, substrate-binding lipoprotein [Corynebacterium glyciniphilum AJ 3170]
MKPLIRSAALLVTVATTLSVTACGGAEDDNTGHTRVLLDWNPNPDHLALYTADHTGAYDEQGLDVEFLLPGNTADAAKDVSLGRADLAISYETDTIIARAEGLDVINVGALIPTPLNSLITKASSGITEPSDLEGKSVATSGLPSQQATLNYIAEQAGIDPESITMPNVQQNLNQALLSDQVDAIFGAYPNIEGVELAQRTDITTLTAAEMGVPSSAELVIIANPTRLSEDDAYADRVRNFLAGTADGHDAAMRDAALAVDALTPETAGAYDPDLLAAMVEATIDILEKGNSDGDTTFGVQNPQAWSDYADWMRENGLLDAATGSNALINGADATTNDYLPA